MLFIVCRRAPDFSILLSFCIVGVSNGGELSVKDGMAEALNETVAELAIRPGHEKVRALLYRLLVEGLGAASREIDFEKQIPEVNGRIDALLGRTVIEIKSDLRRERREAERGLARYLAERQESTGDHFVGLATDGAEFFACFLRNGDLETVADYRTDRESPRALLAWLQGAVAVGDDLPPDPETIAREFGRESLGARRALGDLSELWSAASASAPAQLKRELWGRLLGLAYGAEVDSDDLFLQHTYLATVAKSVAWAAMIAAPPPDPLSLLHGEGFASLGITGQAEPDFFDWVATSDAGGALVMRIWRHVSRFRLQDIRVDILKALYESLIDPETRHDLGEYYTPDWLAARMVAAALTNPLEDRAMDPACGSGTFLFHMVRAVLDEAEKAGLPSAEAARRATEQIAGIDIHPVAVIFARVTYLLALMPALRSGHPGQVALPVYLGDALQWNLARTSEKGAQPDLLADERMLEIFVPPVTLADPKPRRLAAATLRFPAGVAADTQLLDRILRNMIEFGDRNAMPAEFDAWVEKEGFAPAEDRHLIVETYRVMRHLQQEGRNHIWGHVARNLARPVWLASEARKADVVIGNPPWLSSRYMSVEFQKRFRDECKAARLWVGGKVATQQDLASYFYMRAALLYMRRSGGIALVLPYAALSRQAYSAFRKGDVVQAGHVVFRLRFTKAWTFGPEVQPLFPVPSCVLFAKVQRTMSPVPLPETVTAFSGTLPHRNAAPARINLAEETAPWPSEAIASAESHYRRAFRQGASLVPRRLVLVEPVPTVGMLPANPVFPLVAGRRGNQDKAPWKDVTPPQGALETTFLLPALLGESTAPFRILSKRTAVVPWDRERGQLMDAMMAGIRGYARLASWLHKVEALWEAHKRSSMSYKERLDYHCELSAQFPLAPIRVVYTKAGANLASAVVQDDEAIIDHKLYWASFNNLEEARYLCGILNSDALQARVRQYQSQGQWGPRDFDKYVFNLPIPRFDESVGLHRSIASAAEAAERVAAGVPEISGEHFTRTRRRIRAALAERGTAKKLEKLIHEIIEAF